IHVERQRHYSTELYGSIRDGRAAERVQNAIAALPDLDVVLVSRGGNPAAAEGFQWNLEHRVRNVRVRHATETLESYRVAPPGTVGWHPGPDHRLGDWCGIVKAAGRTDAFVASASEPVAWTVGSADPATGQVPRLGLNVPIVRADRGLWGKKDGRYTSDG